MQKDIAGGIFDGLIWVVFFISFVLAAFNFLCDYLGVGLSDGIRSFFASVQTPALYTLIGSVVVAAVAAGREEKGFGKFSKGFGTVYGLINIMSDVLSYARLFGLMLSGMIIAQTFNYKLGLPLIQGGGVGIVFGSVVIVIGHVFNIAMNVLGAYIHDSRLQYIEFFSKFYTGEGRKFTPIGSQMKYIYLKKN
jgi:V/A-type H+-transporting ATPase subunit I